MKIEGVLRLCLRNIFAKKHLLKNIYILLKQKNFNF